MKNKNNDITINNKKKYHIGFYGGKFLPLHKGHRFCAYTAAMECDIVYVILFVNGDDELNIMKNRHEKWLSIDYRIKRMNKMCKELSFLADVIPVVIDVKDVKLPDGTEDWDGETPLVRAVVGDHLDAVYSSEESYGEYFSRAYPEAVHRLVDTKRIHYPISATLIRSMKTYKERKLWKI